MYTNLKKIAVAYVHYITVCYSFFFFFFSVTKSKPKPSFLESKESPLAFGHYQMTTAFQ